MPNIWKDIAAVLPHVNRTLLYGPPGTGKTTLGFSDDREVFYVPLHEETSPAELLGHFVPVGSRFVWFDGPVLLAWQRGARLILDELDQAGGSVMSVLRAILNDPSVARLTLPDPSLAEMSDADMASFIAAGEGFRTVKPAEGFQVIATMNGDPEDLDAPLLDRFEATFYVGETNPEAISALPEDLRDAARKTALDNSDRRVGLRRWKAFATLREKVGEDTASRAVFGSRHGDVMDALRLARPAEATEATESARDEVSVSTGKDESVRIIAPASAVLTGEEPTIVAPMERVTMPAADAPTIYLIKTGKRGRPPRAECPTHGKLTHRTGVISSDGNLTCKFCKTTVALRGMFNRRVKVGPDRWETQEV